MKALLPLLLITFFLSSLIVTSQIGETAVQASVIVNPSLFVTPTNISANVLPFSFLEKNLTFKQNTNFDFNVSLQSAGDVAGWITFSDDIFIIEPSQEKIITLFFEIPDTPAGVYMGNITANDLVIPVEITVADKYKLTSSLEVVPSGIQLGANVTIFATIGRDVLGKIKDVEGRIPVVATYQILKGKQVITSFNTTNEVSDVVEESFTIQIPANASRGRYTAIVTATHLNKKTTSKDGFFVGKPTRLGKFLTVLFSLFG